MGIYVTPGTADVAARRRVIMRLFSYFAHFLCKTEKKNSTRLSSQKATKSCVLKHSFYFSIGIRALSLIIKGSLINLISLSIVQLLKSHPSGVRHCCQNTIGCVLVYPIFLRPWLTLAGTPCIHGNHRLEIMPRTAFCSAVNRKCIIRPLILSRKEATRLMIP